MPPHTGQPRQLFVLGARTCPRGPCPTVADGEWLLADFDAPSFSQRCAPLVPVEHTRLLLGERDRR